MLTSISPVGERGRGQRWAVTVGAYVLASVAGGATTGALLGAAGALALGWLPPSAAVAVLAVAAVVGLGADVGGRPVRGFRRQVDEHWLTRYRGWVYGVGFGYQLGLGVVTVVASSAVWVMFAAAALSQSALAGSAIGGLFGLFRALPLAGTRGVRTVEGLRRLHRRLAAAAGPAEGLTRAALVAVAGVATVGAITWS